MRHDNFDPAGAAEYLNLTVPTLAKWRCYGGGPRFIKAGARIRYRRIDLDAWTAERVRTSTSDTGARAA